MTLPIHTPLQIQQENSLKDSTNKKNEIVVCFFFVNCWLYFFLFFLLVLHPQGREEGLYLLDDRGRGEGLGAVLEFV